MDSVVLKGKHISRSEKRAKSRVHADQNDNQMSERGKAILEGLNDIKNGRYTTVKREDLEQGIKKLFED